MMDREEILRQIAALEASMEQVPYAVKQSLMPNLYKLQDQLRWTDAELELLRSNLEAGMNQMMMDANDDIKAAVDVAVDVALTAASLGAVGIAGMTTAGLAGAAGMSAKAAALATGLAAGGVAAAEGVLEEILIDPAVQFIGGAISGALDDMLGRSIMGDVGKGTELGEIMAAQMPEVVKPGSPKIRAGFEAAERAVVAELDDRAKKLIEELTKKHSPITPDESTVAAGTIAGGSIAGFVGLAAAGAAIEGATLGQMEIPGHFLLQIGAMYGLARMAGSVVSVPYKWGVDIGHNYKWASVFQPMIPGMIDLVRMEVREVWREEFRAEQLEETPSDDFKVFSALQGYSGFHADSYWAAHWELPTVHQAYEMFHRLRPGRDPTGLTFTREDLYKLMRRQDILKRYRDPLIAIAYEVPTRREIRMMVNAGTLSRDEAEEMYLDRGVDPQFAGILADFAWARAQRDPYRDRIITAAIGLAKEGYDTEDKFRERLKEREVPEQVIGDAWELAQIQYEADYKRDLLAELRERLRKGKITIETFAAELSRIVPVAERANAIVERERARIKLVAS